MNWLWVDNLNLCYHWSDVGWFRDVNRFRHYYWFNICWLNVVDHRRWHICSLNGITYEMLMVLISVLMDMHIFAMIVNDFRFMINFRFIVDWIMNGDNRLDNDWLMGDNRFDDDRFMDDDWINIVW